MRLVFICALSLFAATFAATSACTPALRALEIKKGVYGFNERPFYLARLNLPADSAGKVQSPSNFEEAVEQLSTGLEGQVISQAMAALTAACGSVSECNFASPELWDKFIAESEAIEVEPGHALSSFLFRLDERLGEVWELDSPCKSSAELCMALRTRVDGSSAMLAEVVVRASIIKRMGSSVSMEVLILGMGDMVRTVRE